MITSELIYLTTCRCELDVLFSEEEGKKRHLFSAVFRRKPASSNPSLM